MDDEPEDQMSVAELLEVRANVRRQLEIDTPHYTRGVRWGGEQRDNLQAILDEIEVELAELGYKDA